MTRKSRHVLLTTLIIAVTSASLASVARAHVLDGHVITGGGTTNYGNALSITSTDLPVHYGTASYGGMNIPLDCVDMSWSLFSGLSASPTHDYVASGSAQGHTYYFAITNTLGYASRAVVQKDTGKPPCVFASMPYGTPPSDYEHGGAFRILP